MLIKLQTEIKAVVTKGEAEKGDIRAIEGDSKVNEPTSNELAKTTEDEPKISVSVKDNKVTVAIDENEFKKMRYVRWPIVMKAHVY